MMKLFSMMQRLFSFLLVGTLLQVVSAEGLEQKFINTYALWQKAMVTKNFHIWDSVTASERKKEIKNKIYSEKFTYPDEIFASPFPPPPLDNLQLVQAKATDDMGKAVFLGPIDFGIGGELTENLLVVSYQLQESFWRYVGAEYVNLIGLPKIREDLKAGDYTYLKGDDFQPSPYKRKNAIELSGAVPIITKVYAYCPGREVRALVNSVSSHKFQNTKQAEVVIGGGREGSNEIQVAVSQLPGGQGDEPLCVRVYALSKVQGVLPIKVYEYLVNEGEDVKSIQTINFNIDQATLDTLAGKK